jgi:hypothetical protein
MSSILRIGDRFNRLVVTGSPVVLKKNWPAKYPVRCDCGKEGMARGWDLVHGTQKSCGCLQREAVSARNKTRKTHGGTNTRLYQTWSNMWDRCSNSNTRSYEGYGGRGITICKEWEGFAAFKEWAEANGYADNLTIDRKQNDDGYNPENCRWVTTKENNRNKRYHRLLTAFGETKMIAEWVEDDRCQVSLSTLQGRVRKGWHDEDAISKPSCDQRRFLTAFGETKSLVEWTKDERCRTNRAALQERLNMGWEDERAISTPTRPIKHTPKR